MSMAMKYGMMQRGKKAGCSGPDCTGCSSPICMAGGGEVDDDRESYVGERHHTPKPGTTGVHRSLGGGGESQTGDHARAASDTTRSASEREYNRKAAKESHHAVIADQRAMKKPHGHYAEGGMVDSGEEGLVDRIMKRFASGEPAADFESNDFDELDKEPAPDDADTGENSGDELGDKAVEEEDEDVISKVMKSRKKSDRMPRPA